MINLLLWLLLGALVGWLASIVMHTDYEQGPLLNRAETVHLILLPPIAWLSMLYS